MKSIIGMKNIIELAFICLTMCVTACTMLSCSDDDSQQPEEPGTYPTALWSKTMKGNGEELGAYPDLYSNYWEYTYRQDENADKIICFKGQYPHCRYMSFSIYNDETGTAIKGIDDVNIQPDKGSQNPFEKTITGLHYFTVYVVSSDVSQATLDKLGTENIVKVDANVKKVMVCLRQYLGTKADGQTLDEYGGVDLPQISALDAQTLKHVTPPAHVESNVYKITSQVFQQRSDEFKNVPFFLAPASRYYPNKNTDYLYARTHLRTDSVLTFSFIPVTAPAKPEEYAAAPARYWSICLGSGADTRSYYSICDRDARFSAGKKSDFVVCLKNNPRLAEIQAKVNSLNAQGGRVNLIVWDSEKKNIDGKPIGEIIVIMYRNILPNKDFEYSISRMKATAYKDATGEPIDHVTEPEKQLAHLALGDYGPYGTKISTTDYLK